MAALVNSAVRTADQLASSAQGAASAVQQQIAAPSGEGPLVDRVLVLSDLQEWIPRLVAMAPDDLADLLDVLVDNVFAHTPDGTDAIGLTSRSTSSTASWTA